MTQVYAVRLVALEPISLGIDSEVAFRRDVYRHVPGVALRGALAALWIGRFGLPHGTLAGPFRSLFEVELRPGPLISAGGYLQPLSVSSCKYPADEAHREASRRDEAFAARPAGADVCGVGGCTGPVLRGRGEVTFVAGSDPVESLMHVTHDRDIAADGGLHARRYLRPGTEFTGQLVGPTGDAFLAEFGKPTEVWLGARRTVAGRAELTLTPTTTASAPSPRPPSPPSPSPPPSPSTPPDIPAGTDIVLRLVSSAIFTDDYGRPAADVPVDDLATALGVSPGAVTVAQRWLRETVVGGWHVATGLPKPADRATVAGSTWVLRVNEAVPYARLAQLSLDGLGLRRAEGFGQVEFANVPWLPPATPTAAVPAAEPALAHAAALWQLVAQRDGAQRDLLALLRELGSQPVSSWRLVVTAFTGRTPGRRLARTGALSETVDPVAGAVDGGTDAVSPVAALVAMADPDLLRDVRQVLDARRLGGAGPEWLRRHLPDRGTYQGSANGAET